MNFPHFICCGIVALIEYNKNILMKWGMAVKIVVVSKHSGLIYNLINKSFPSKAEVFCFSDAQKAKAFSNDIKIDALIIDAKLDNNLSGFKFISGLKNKYPGLITVCISDTEEYAVNAFEIKVDGFIVEPINEAELINIIKNKKI